MTIMTREPTWTNSILVPDYAQLEIEENSLFSFQAKLGVQAFLIILSVDIFDGFDCPLHSIYYDIWFGFIFI